MNIDLKELFKSNEEGINPKMQNTLLAALKENAQPNFDYLKFKQSVETMKTMGMDEETRLKSAYATAAVMGLTKESLIKSANQYKGVLDKEKEAFANALKKQISKNIDGRRVEAQRLAEEIESHKKKILKLQKEMEIYQAKIDGVEDEVEQSKNKIESTRDSFKLTFDELYESIQDDIILIDRYL